MESLPNEVLMMILRYLEYDDRVMSSRVSKIWGYLISTIKLTSFTEDRSFNIKENMIKNHTNIIMLDTNQYYFNEYSYQTDSIICGYGLKIEKWINYYLRKRGWNRLDQWSGIPCPELKIINMAIEPHTGYYLIAYKYKNKIYRYDENGYFVNTIRNLHKILDYKSDHGTYPIQMIFDSCCNLIVLFANGKICKYQSRTYIAQFTLKERYHTSITTYNTHIIVTNPSIQILNENGKYVKTIYQNYIPLQVIALKKYLVVRVSDGFRVIDFDGNIIFMVNICKLISITQLNNACIACLIEKRENFTVKFYKPEFK